MIRRALTQFMMGRYGGDQLNLFLIALYFILWVLSVITGWWVLRLLGTVVILYCLFRTMSRQIEKRRAENSKFLTLAKPAMRSFHSFRLRVTDREHRYFKCPNCGQQMRVPRGKGRITVHCRSCGASFEEKS